MTDDDVRRGIAHDPDTFEVTEALLSKARLRHPDSRVVEGIMVDADIAAWVKADPARRSHLVNERLRELMKDDAA